MASSLFVCPRHDPSPYPSYLRSRKSVIHPPLGASEPLWPEVTTPCPREHAGHLRARGSSARSGWCSPCPHPSSPAAYRVRPSCAAYRRSDAGQHQSPPRARAPGRICSSCRAAAGARCGAHTDLVPHGTPGYSARAPHRRARSTPREGAPRARGLGAPGARCLLPLKPSTPCV